MWATAQGTTGAGTGVAKYVHCMYVHCMYIRTYNVHAYAPLATVHVRTYELSCTLVYSQCNGMWHVYVRTYCISPVVRVFATHWFVLVQCEEAAECRQVISA